MKNFVLENKLEPNICKYNYKSREEDFQKSIIELRRYIEINQINIDEVIVFYSIYAFLLETDIFSCLDSKRII